MKKLIILLVLMAGCQDIPYRKDANMNFMPSAVANSPEYPIWVNGKMCRDNSGVPGLCAIRTKANASISLEIMAQQYPLNATLTCTTAVMPDPQKVTVMSGKGFKFIVPSESFKTQRFFNCTVLITPLDREEPIAAFARIAIVVVDAEYTSMPTPYYNGEYVVFGEHANTVWWEDADGRHWAKEKTAAKSKGFKRAIVESYLQRIATVGF